MESNFPTLPVKRAFMASNGSSKMKRSKKAHPLIIPSGHIAFRMLCHASRIGGVIGKSGLVIKQLQQATGAKIRVEEAPNESPDRVVTVIAPSVIASRISLVQNPSDFGGNGEEFEVSKAQEALLKVFERILEVAAESEGVGAGIGADFGVVSCRLLAESAQIGPVIGKGGKVVEKIRKESGCKIKVLSDKLPACAGPSDEMIEIEGDVLAIKKALLAVSRCLQDCPTATGDKMRMVASRPPETIIHETLPDLHVDHLFQRNSFLPSFPSNSSIFASGIHSLSIDADVASPVDTKVMQQEQEVVFKILCASDRVGGVIGKGGTIIRALQNESGASLGVGPTIAGCDERLISITASENFESRYSPAQKAVVLVFSRSIDVGIEKGLDVSSNKVAVARLAVPSNQVGCVLGKGGAIIAEIRKVTGTNIRIISGDQVPKCASEKDEVVQISGEFSNVQDALYNVTGRLRDNLFSSVLSNSGTRNEAGPSMYPETSPYGRQRDPVPLGLRTIPSVGFSHNFMQHTTQSTDNYGLSHNLDSPPSPRLWVSQPLTGVNSRGIPDAVRGFPSLRGGVQLGSGSKTALVTNTTVDIVVPDDVIDLVYGENGANLARLRQISGAKVTVHAPDPVTNDRLIVISGTPDETQAAQSLLHAFILTGSS